MAEEAVTFSIKNRNRVLWALRRIGPEIKAETEKASGVIARKFVRDTRAAASTPREHAIVSSATVRKHLVPKVAFGGSVLLATREPVTAGKLFFGTEFGGRQAKGRWWFPHRGRKGYVIYPTLRAHGKQYATLWHVAVDRALDKAAKTSERVSRG